MASLVEAAKSERCLPQQERAAVGVRVGLSAACIVAVGSFVSGARVSMSLFSLPLSRSNNDKKSVDENKTNACAQSAARFQIIL